MTGLSIAFYIAAAVAIAAALMVVWHRHPVINALYLVVCFFAVAAIYVMLHAHFLAVIQVLVYAGAVLVLFVIIIMLVTQGPNEPGAPKVTLGKGAGGFASLLLAAILVAMFLSNQSWRQIQRPGQAIPQEVAAFLIDRGVSRNDLDYKVAAQAGDDGRILEIEDSKAVARDLLNRLKNDQTKDYIELPELFSEMSYNEIDDTVDEVILVMNDLGLNEPLDSIEPIRKAVKQASTDEEARQITLDFIDAAAMARMKQFEEFGTTRSVGRFLFSRYILPFEVASLLLLAAIVGVMVLARREKDGGK